MAHTDHHARRAEIAAPAGFDSVGLASLGAAAGAATAVGPPPNEDAQGWRAEGIRDQTESKQPDCATPPEHDQDSGRFAMLAALAARSGIALHELAGGYLLCRWDRCRELPDLRAVALLLRQMGLRQ